MSELLRVVEEYKADFATFMPAIIHSLAAEDIGAQGNYAIDARDIRTGARVSFEVENRTYIAVLDRILRKRGLAPNYYYSGEYDNVIMTSAGHSKEEIERLLGQASTGIIMFLNWKEPGEGTQPLHQVFPKAGDAVMLAYVAPRKT